MSTDCIKAEKCGALDAKDALKQIIEKAKEFVAILEALPEDTHVYAMNCVMLKEAPEPREDGKMNLYIESKNIGLPWAMMHMMVGCTEQMAINYGDMKALEKMNGFTS